MAIPDGIDILANTHFAVWTDPYNGEQRMGLGMDWLAAQEELKQDPEFHPQRMESQWDGVREAVWHPLHMPIDMIAGYTRYRYKVRAVERDNPI